MLKNYNIIWLGIFIILALILIVFIEHTLLSSALNLKAAKLCNLYFDNKTVLKDIPLAETLPQKIKGLSGTHCIGNGMIFRFAEPLHATFWMVDTYVWLSIGFFSEEGTLFQIEDMQPHTSTLHRAAQPVAYALELPRGQFAKLKLNTPIKLLRVDCQTFNYKTRISQGIDNLLCKWGMRKIS